MVAFSTSVAIHAQPTPAAPKVAEITSADQGPAGDDILWYKKPAANWYEALPVGNGRLGAMVFGDTKLENIQLNEDTVWSGGPYQPAQASALEAIKQARALIFARTPEANQRAVDLLYQKTFGRPIRETSYLPLGNLALTFPDAAGPITGYIRSLDLDTAISSTTYKAGDITFTREVFASAPDQVIAVRITADKPGSVNFTAAFTCPLNNFVQAADGNVLTLTGNGTDYAPSNKAGIRLISKGSQTIADVGVKGAIVAHARLMAKNEGGAVSVSDAGLTVQNADAVTLLISAATNFVNYNDVSGDAKGKASAALTAAGAKTYGQLKAAHLADYQALFRRVSIDLGKTDAAKLPTDERISGFAKGQDPAMAALFFQYGRYLLISSSRSGGQPANLQGLWNGANYKTGELDMSGRNYSGSPMQPAWGSKYTTNINLEMNYWPAETANLSECTEPLIAMIKDLSATGAITARTMYGANGWVLHHNTDLWRGTAPVDWPPTGMWPMGGAWLCTHLWEHYQFTGDKAFLKDAYPLMKGASQFFVDTLVEDRTHPDKHWMVTCPSFSPENGGLCAGPTMDNCLLRDLFSQTARASEILGVDADFRQRILALRDKLPPFQIGKWGQLQEWLDDIDRPNDDNRHVSQLYSVFPSNQITVKTPDLFKAAQVSLEHRGDAGTGWSLAWKINFWARFLNGNHAYLILTHLLDVPGSHGHTFDTGGGTYPNLLDAHTPFQIDGNFGVTSGIAEMLLQSQNGEIDLLPALPDAWPNGSVSGLCARGGFTIDETWQAGKLQHAVIHSTWGTTCTVLHGSASTTLNLQPGQSAPLDGNLQPSH